ncbi:hypothetical protein SL057_002415 [Flavobacterium psychrophilum]|nr:hypothetical protein [Flavobacterium psychrophilum]
MLENLRFAVIQTVDIPTIEKVTKTLKKYTSTFDYGNLPHNEGDIVSIQSILKDTENNYFKRVQDILIYFEQTDEKYSNKDDKFLADLIQATIKNHSLDLGITSDNFELPSVGEILSFIEEEE